MLSKNFYIEFGKVVYSMAMADGDVQEEERARIVELVREKIAPLEEENDEFGTSLAFFTLFSFESEDENRMAIDVTMGSFSDYLKKYQKPIPLPMRKALVKTIKEIAKSYGRFTISEKELFETFVDDIENYSGK